MDMELTNNIIYANNLDTARFARMFNTTAQSYKFYWLEAILNLLASHEGDIVFEEIVDEMICEAWHTVTHFHLHLGPSINGNAENFLEHAINTLNVVVNISNRPSRDELLAAIREADAQIRADKLSLVNLVPYRLLYPFLNVQGMEEGFEYLKNNSRTRLIAYLEKMQGSEKLLYTFVDGVGLNKKIRMNPDWRRFMLENYAVIRSWVQYHKAQYLQDRNPGVPGIIYKLCPEADDVRRLDQARALWRATVDVTGQPIREIYTGAEIGVEELSIDHFVPHSYISNDELWNLVPMRRSLNSSKNNRLPQWDRFFGEFAAYQFYLYDLVFPESDEARVPILIERFNKCRKNNVNAIWASENLYIGGNSREQFTNMLEHNLKPIYEAARQQGYDIWQPM